MTAADLNKKYSSPKPLSNEQAASATGHNHQLAETIDKHIEDVKEAADKVEASVNFFSALRLLGHFISVVAHTIPPIRLALEAVNTGWDIVKNVFITRGSRLSTGAKIAYALCILGAAIGVVVFPVVAAIIYAASAGLTLIKDVTKTFITFKEYQHINHELKKAEKDLSQLPPNSEPSVKTRLQQQVTQLTTAKAKAKSEVRENGINAGLSFLVLVGTVLAIFPPTTVVGVSLLAATAVVGIAVKVGPKIGGWIKNKWNQRNKTTANKRFIENNEEPKNKLGLFNQLKNKLSNKKTNSLDDTSTLVGHSTVYELATILDKSHDIKHVREDLMHAANLIPETHANESSAQETVTNSETTTSESTKLTDAEGSEIAEETQGETGNDEEREGKNGKDDEDGTSNGDNISIVSDEMQP